LLNLKNHLAAGFITKEEYQERKVQLIDEMTGTTLTRSAESRAVTSTRARRKEYDHIPAIIPKGPPNFDLIPAENATKLTFDLTTRTWQNSAVQVKLDTVPFSRGALRLVYHLLDLSEETSSGVSYVAKISLDPRDNQDRDIYFKDVEMQSVAKFYAKQFNEYNPPKKVDFVKAWILRLDDREGAPLCAVEHFIDGPYRKHNNNYGYVSEEERNTPQAFSHFTYESSNHTILCVDIQGVSDMYTDPQVHSVEGKGFGKGNMGQRGIDKFLQKHRCNAICRYLKLPSINANYSNLGTLPVTRVMSYEHVRVVDIVPHSGPLPPIIDARSPLLKNAQRSPGPATTNAANAPATNANNNANATTTHPAASAGLPVQEDDSSQEGGWCCCIILVFCFARIKSYCLLCKYVSSGCMGSLLEWARFGHAPAGSRSFSDHRSCPRNLCLGCCHSAVMIL